MKIDFDILPDCEPGKRTGFTHNDLNSDSENRDESLLASAIENPSSRYILLAEKGVLIHKDKSSTAHFSRNDAEQMNAKFTGAILLGTRGSVSYLAVPVKIEEAELQEPWKIYDLRALLYTSSVGEGDVGTIAQAISLMHWNRMNLFCGKCSAPTEMKIGGYRRDCTSCSNQQFPRTDPVVIMLAITGDKCLLGRNPAAPNGWYSTLAGFVEPGETIEDAVRRETFEESGIHIGKVKYHASQPWPFPHTLMLGCYCEALSEELTIDENELEDCRWFTRGEVLQMLEESHPEGILLPPQKAIATLLIKDWVEG